jgi:flagellar basal body-associated protein FliL
MFKKRSQRGISVTPNITDPAMRAPRSEVNERPGLQSGLQSSQGDRSDLLSDLGEPDTDEILFKKTTTQEEQQPSKPDTTILIIIFALVVIALIAIIIWIMMKDTDKAAEHDVKQMLHQRPQQMPRHRPQKQNIKIDEDSPAQTGPSTQTGQTTQTTQPAQTAQPTQPVQSAQPEAKLEEKADVKHDEPKAIKLVGLIASQTSADDILKQTQIALNPQYDDADRALLNSARSAERISMTLMLDEIEADEFITKPSGATVELVA